MSQIDRRTLIGVAGASVAVAACNPGGGSDGGGDGGGDYGGKDERGINEQWGEDPHKPAPDVPPPGGFKPAYICAIYIRFDEGNKAVIRHGYYETGPMKDGEDAKAFDANQIKAAEEMLADAASAEDWKASRIGYPRKEVNFEGFDFGQQMRLFAVVDNDSVKFDDRMTDGKYANLVRFTKYQTTEDMANFKPKLTNPNHAFFGATLIDLNVGNKKRKALQLDNWYAGPKGQAIKKDDPKTHQYFALDLHVLWEATQPGTKIKAIPIVIDPDGGNMGGTP
jgi:hypothetical protein